jgi:hypothetical protein
MSESFRRWRPRFRLASLLWLMLCVALTIGTYRWAYQSGREDALAERTFVGRTHARAYDLQEIMPILRGPGNDVVLDFDSIMRDLKQEVLPNTWTDNGGNAAMAEFPANISLVISHDDDGHERIAAWMKRRREQMERQGTPTIASVVNKAPPRK